MNRTLAIILVVLGFGAAVVMWYIGSNSSHLSELADTWWIPLALGIVGLFGLMSKKKPTQ